MVAQEMHSVLVPCSRVNADLLSDLRGCARQSVWSDVSGTVRTKYASYVSNCLRKRV